MPINGEYTFITRNADGTLSLTIPIPETETFKVAKHGFVIDNGQVPLASHIHRYIYGRRAINDAANSSKPSGADLSRDEAQAFINDYLDGNVSARAVDPVTKESRIIAKAYLMSKKFKVTTAKEAIATDLGKTYFTNTKVGVAWVESAVDAYIAKFDLAQTEAGKPELGFVARARAIVETRGESSDEVDVAA